MNKKGTRVMTIQECQRVVRKHNGILMLKHGNGPTFYHYARIAIPRKGYAKEGFPSIEFAELFTTKREAANHAAAFMERLPILLRGGE